MKAYVFYDDFKENDILFFPAYVYKIKRKPKFSLVYLRHEGKLLTTALRPELCEKVPELQAGMYAEFRCVAVKEFHAENGLELNITDFNILSVPAVYPNAAAADTGVSVSEEIESKNIFLLNGSFNYIYRFGNYIKYAFRDFMVKNGFFEADVPLITSETAEISFELDYFGKTARVSTSPLFHLVPLTAAFERVFATARSVSGRRRGSTRHLNEFTQMCFTAGYIENLDDVIELTLKLMRHIMSYLADNYADFLNENKITLPDTENTAVITAKRAFELLNEPEGPDLNPTDIKKLCDILKKDFVFVKDFTGGEFYVSKKDGNFKRFRLLYKGMSIASGSENIYDYDELIKSAEKHNKAVPAVLADALKYGVMPYGYASIGLERFVMKLLDLSDIRRAAVFPRDTRHI